MTQHTEQDPTVPALPKAAEVIVVGAGPAGLACALDLTGAGREVLVLEAADDVGGRMRTDVVRGFRLDRGFQVFNTAYPQVRRRLDLAALRLHPFTPGILLADGGRSHLLLDPTRRPGRALDVLRGGALPPRDLVALGLLGLCDAVLPAALLKRMPETSTARALRRAGVSERTVEGALRPFLAGVFLEDRLETSSRMFHLVWRSMLRGSLCLPQQGIGAVPRQLAAGLPPGRLVCGAPVDRLTAEGVVLADGVRVRARTVVVATGSGAAARLLPGLEVPAARAVTTFYHAAPVRPLDGPLLVVDSRGPVLNTVVLSEVVPDCSPDGRALVSTSVRGVAAEEGAVRRRAGELYGVDVSGWEPLAAYRIPEALPAGPVPLELSRTTRFAPGRYVCGDHRATASLQGALASGARAAREVSADLAGSRT
ncbi:FAD-dependent oxidoreductase [Kitasatospora purpeofusca]|uniref:NAD(P)/FAD-dependent oxidoreductase n=1 Tax=Kitasatospora purpeofusca TaxID=67352 RepID=UPI002252CC00|nr:NAD(P)/FAD-dependent oxidoreductase [Kitasatospora purpeofusca]MCX4690145.1 FAD-dependent oxidoreductase [Kitasatospora purpeofusca]